MFRRCVRRVMFVVGAALAACAIGVSAAVPGQASGGTLAGVRAAGGVALPANFGFLLAWGGVGSGDGQVGYPFGVATDPAGSVYVAETTRIQKFSSTGVFLGKWGSYGLGDGQFTQAYAVAADRFGNVYVADRGNNRIERFSSTGVFLGKWGSHGSGDGEFDVPSGVAADPSGNVYVADNLNSRIQKFSSTGVFLGKWGSLGSGDGQFSHYFGVATDPAGNVYVGDAWNNRIQKFSSSGVFLGKWGSYGSGDGEFSSPFGVASDAAGDIYVADAFNDRIQKFSSSGVFLGKWGSNGAGDGEFYTPEGIATDPSGNVYVADTNNHRIQKFGELPPGTNLVPDADVELAPSAFYYTNGPATFSWATDASRSPAHALKIVSTTGSGALARWMTQMKLIRATPGVDYSVSAFLKTSSVAQYAEVAVSFWTDHLAYSGVTVSSAQPVSGSRDWTQVALRARAPGNATYLRVEIRLYGVGTLWGDDLSVTTSLPGAPVNTTPPSISGSPMEGNTLTAATGVWTSPAVFVFQWRADGVDIAGATATTYLLTPPDIGKRIAVVVTAIGPGGSASSVSAETAPVSPRTTVELAPDPHFELNPVADYYTNGAGTFSWATDQSRSPTHALKIATGQPAGAIARWMTNTTAIPVSPGKAYDVSAWLKTQAGNASSGQLVITYWTTAQAYVAGSATASAQLLTGTRDWTQATLLTTAPAGASSMRVEFRLTGPGILWADDVSVTAR